MNLCNIVDSIFIGFHSSNTKYIDSHFTLQDKSDIICNYHFTVKCNNNETAQLIKFQKIN